MAWDHFGTYKMGAQSAQELHIQNVYKDPEFIDGVELIFPDHEAFIRKLHLVTHEQQNQMLKKLQELNASQLTELAQKYAIRLEDVYFYLSGQSEVHTAYRKEFPYHMAWDDKGNYTAKFKLDITKEDFMEIWKVVERHKKQKYDGKIPKNKVPVNDKLLYTIFKLRQRNIPFSQIYKMYTEQRLPNYTGGYSGLNSEDKLEQFYRRHKPTA